MPAPSGSLPEGDAFFEHAACGLLVTAIDGTIRRANATFCQWIGYRADELRDKRRVQELFTMGGRVFHQTHWAPLLELQGSVAEVALDMRHRDGHALPMLLNVVRREHGGVPYNELAFFVATDRQNYERELVAARQRAEDALATLRQAQAALSAADRRKDEFLATLAHELRNPLAPMRNVLHILKLKQLDDPQLQWARDVFERQIRHMTHLVDDLMEVSRITQGKLALRKAPLDLAEAMRSAVEGSTGLIEAASHNLQVSYPEQPIVVDADGTRVTQMILNLLNNAAKYTPAGGSIWLEAHRDGAQAVLSVRDSGIGIRAEHLAGVFEMFSQLAPALERSQGGLGIGLALVRGLAELHGGAVEAHSAGVGRGSRFVIRLPLQELPPQADAVREPGLPVPGDGRRILVVDDNIDAAQSMVLMLQITGYNACAAHDGAGGLALAAAFAPEAILLDIGLPDLNGYEVARRIRAEEWGRRMLLVASTGWGQEQDKLAALDAGFDFHLTKPIDFDELDAILKPRNP